MSSRLRVGRALAALLAAAALPGVPLRAQPARSARREPDGSAAVPEWVIAVGPSSATAADSVTPRHVPGSRATYTQRAAREIFGPPDWFPDAHPPMPEVVAHGRRPDLWACAYCHLPDGRGRPENAELAGLPVDYMVQQVAAMRDSSRGTPWRVPSQPWASMHRIAVAATDAEITEAARYFAGIPARRRAQVVEAARIPRVVPVFGYWALVPGADSEPLAGRLVEAPVSVERHELRDPGVPYVAYVPPGSVATGRAIARRGIRGVVAPCASCHGAGLRGVGLVPGLAGRSPSYLLRQLLSFQSGARREAASAPMRLVAGPLAIEDMIAAAAYAATLDP